MKMKMAQPQPVSYRGVLSMQNKENTPVVMARSTTTNRAAKRGASPLEAKTDDGAADHQKKTRIGVVDNEFEEDSIATNSAKNDSSPSAAKTETNNDLGGFFALANFIAPSVVQFIGVRSLVRFSATCKANKAVVAKEVERRKVRMAAIEAEVKELMGSQPESIPLRENVKAARKLAENAKRLIDDEIGFHEKICSRKLSLEYDDGLDWRDFDFFLEERKKFIDSSMYHSIRGVVGSFSILPDCFYFPPEGESSSPSQEALQKSTTTACWLWVAEDLMQAVYESPMYDENWDQMNYDNPFNKFHLSGADEFTEYMDDTAYELAHDGTIDAFRIAARKLFFDIPDSRDYFWYTLEKADNVASGDSD